MSDEGIRIQCQTCVGKTRHVRKYVEEISPFSHYELLRCAGCDSVTMRHMAWTDDFEEIVTLYPPRSNRKKPDWIKEIDETEPSLKALLDEVYVAVDGNALRLTAMGIRSVFDHVMHEKVGDHGSFASNLTAFEEAKFISSTQKETLQIVIEVGSATIHRGFRPSAENIDAILGVMESVVKSIYLDHPNVQKIKIPPRPPPIKS